MTEKRQLIALAVPLLAGNLLQQLYNTLDSLIIGRFLGTDAFAAAGVAGTLMNLFIFVLNGFSTGLCVPFAQFYGTGNYRRFRQEMFIAVSLGSLLTFALSGLFIVLLLPLIRLIRTPVSLTAYVSSYLTIIIGGMITTYLYNIFSSILRAAGDTKAALYFLVISTIINAALDYIFVAICGLGIAGAAWATVIAQMISAICCFIYLRTFYRFLICGRPEIGLHKDLLKNTLRFGMASAFQESNLYIGKLLIQGAVNTLGTAGIAAYAATMRIEGFANSFADSGGLAVSVFTAQNYGRGDQVRVREGLRQGLFLHMILGSTIAVILFFTAEKGTAAFLSSGTPLMLSYGASYLKIISLFYVLCFIGNINVGYFRGLGLLHVPVIGTIANIVTRVIFSYLAVARYGLSAIALATGLGWVVIIAYQLMIHRRYNYLKL